MAQYRRPGEARRPKLIFAIFLIVAGILLFLANLGFLPIQHVWNYWPLIFVAMGLSRLSSGRPAGLLAGGMLVTGGVLFTLINVGVFRLRLHDGSWPLSLLFLALGIGGLVKVLEGGDRGRVRPFDGNPEGSDNARFTKIDLMPNEGPDLAPTVDNYTILGTIKRKIESQAFQGGKLTSILGNIEIDLRRARMPDGVNTALIEASTVMGSIKLRVPETWHINWNGDSVMSSMEDKTIPPPNSNAPQLVITGSSLMGKIEIES